MRRTQLCRLLCCLVALCGLTCGKSQKARAGEEAALNKLAPSAGTPLDLAIPSYTLDMRADDFDYDTGIRFGNQGLEYDLNDELFLGFNVEKQFEGIDEHRRLTSDPQNLETSDWTVGLSAGFRF